MASRYLQGSNFERRVIKSLRKQGMRAHRTAGSHTPIDIMAGSDGRSWGIQSQLDKYFPPLKVEALVDECKAYGAVAMLCWRGDRHDKYKIHFKEVKDE